MKTKKLEVIVNGKTYEVEVREHSKEVVHQKIQESATSKMTKPQKEIVRLSEVGSDVTSEHGFIVESPLPGKVLRVLVGENEAVEPNTVLCIIEAMKMENEILAGRKGLVEKVFVKENNNVIVNEKLFLIK